MKTILNVKNETIKKMSFNEIKKILFDEFIEYVSLNKNNLCDFNYDDFIDLCDGFDGLDELFNIIKNYNNYYIVSIYQNEYLLYSNDNEYFNVYDMITGDIYDICDLHDMYKNVNEMNDYVIDTLNNELLKIEIQTNVNEN